MIPKILVSVVQIRPQEPFFKAISKIKFFEKNVMRVYFKNTPNTHFFACLWGSFSGLNTMSGP